MKAPDSIYIQTNAGEALSSKWTTIPFRNFENTKYIREDALIEWAEETYLSENASAIRKVCFKQLVEKLMSM